MQIPHSGLMLPYTWKSQILITEQAIYFDNNLQSPKSRYTRYNKSLIVQVCIENMFYRYIN